mmetsp:Transcript_3935/g.5112  ORF Transcript_3935/g.5112 Transcript_3935/m.5112 type:complete len:332 (+) Transcript_3935:20-1015(+)|eukprot:CAMPEP_0117751256 /NCGR_PEP_ID=MMETSP0947-20121206/10861_1 /TAXON_ID=44440 /ORGANISM="Chattonella subsalsa, Strain CCMP2191" /LENGTH=331 /DNA_ID=CAMNT_0005569591 /DNA_START=772 /DNA_END=1767 /DNA_ORIENTATION=-
MEDQEGKREGISDEHGFISGLNYWIGKINELVEDFDRGSLGQTSFIGGFKAEMEKIQIFIQKNKHEHRDSKRYFEKIIENQGYLARNQKSLVNNHNINVDKKILDVEKKMAEDNNGIMKSLQEIREQMDRDRLEFTHALKNGEKQSKTWVDMALGNNLAIREKMKDIKETTEKMMKQNELREKEVNFNNLVFKGIKEGKGEDSIQTIVELLNSNISGCRVQKSEIVSVRRVGNKDLLPRLVVVRFVDKAVRDKIWVKRCNLGKKSKIFVELDLSYKQRSQLRKKIAEIKEYNGTKQEGDRVHFNRYGQHLLINGKKYMDFSVDIASFVANS